jgi:uncharacterized protein (DUF1697 family)
MTRYVAFFRGINVAGRQKIAMEDLSRLLAGLGHADVVTLQQSGNAVFTSDEIKPDRLASQIEWQITREFRMSVSCVVRSGEQLREVVANNPLGHVATDPARLLVIFLSTVPDPDRLSDIDPAAFAPDAFEVGEREIYQWCPNGVSVTRLTQAFWEKRLQLVATARNWNTVTRLSKIAES